MILLEDKVLDKLLKLNRLEMLTYLLINRYLREGQPVPLDNLMKLTYQNKLELSQTLSALFEKELITPPPDELDEGQLAFKDPINDLTGFWGSNAFDESSAEEQYVIDLLNLVNKDTNEYPNKFNYTLGEADFKSLSEDQVNTHLSRALKNISRVVINRSAPDIVNHLADRLTKRHGIDRTAEWRRNQLSCAKKLLRNYDLTVKDWVKAIDHLLDKEYWKDKLTSLKQVENNIHQYLSKKKKSALTHKVRVIS